MGEKICVVSKLELGRMNFDIELNAGSAMAKYPLHIHIQNEHFRFDITESDYIQMAVAMNTAKRMLLANKNMVKIQ
jgi:hypothetical protein